MGSLSWRMAVRVDSLPSHSLEIRYGDMRNTDDHQRVSDDKIQITTLILIRGPCLSESGAAPLLWSSWWSNLLLNIHCWPSHPTVRPQYQLVQDTTWIYNICVHVKVVNMWKTCVNREFLVIQYEHFSIFSSDRSSYSDSVLLLVMAGNFFRFWAFLPIYLVFLFENWMQVDNNWPLDP